MQSNQNNIHRSQLWPLLLIAFLLFVIYFNSFNGTFIFDDIPNITSNKHVHLEHINVDGIKNTLYGVKEDTIYRPLSYLSFGLNYYFHEFDVFGYHLVNLIIHCLTALFLYLFIFHTLRLPILAGKYARHAGSIALLATVLWAVSPIQVTAVTYIVQRMASMAGMFFIMSMFFYLMGRTSDTLKRKIVFFTLCIIAGFLSLASKENAAMLPVIIFLYDLILIQGVSRENIRKHLIWGGFALALLIGMAFWLTNPFNILSGYSSREFSLEERLMTQSRILWYYVSLMLYPVMDRLTLIHEIELSTSLFSPRSTLPAILGWAWVLAAAIFMSRKWPLISFCILFFLINHLIESSFIPLELIFEHRNYIPSMAFFLLLAVCVFQLIEYLRNSGKYLAYGFVLILLTFFIYDQGHTVIKRNELFHHPLYIWEDNVKKSPGLSRTHANLGMVYWHMQEHEKARALFTRAIEADRYHRHSLRAAPLINMGNYYLFIADDPLTAIEYYEQAREIRPKYWAVWHRQALALIHLDELKYAQMFLEQSTQSVSANSDLHHLYGQVLLHQNDLTNAIFQARQAINFNPENTKALKILGEAHRQLGNYEQAIEHWQNYNRANPDDLEAHLALVDLARTTDNDILLKRSAVRILSLKSGRPWQELFNTLPQYKSELAYTGDPMDLIPAIKTGVQEELDLPGS